MEKYESNGIGNQRRFMNEMNRHFTEAIDNNGHCELRKPIIDVRFMLPPVVVIEPMIPESLNLGHGRPIYSASASKLP